MLSGSQQVPIWSNAIQHTPAEGRVSVEVAAAADRVVVTIADTGSGIAAEDLPNVFDRFYKGSGSRGSGLGLAIARDLARAHGGDVVLESTNQSGTCFRVDIPDREKNR